MAAKATLVSLAVLAAMLTSPAKAQWSNSAGEDAMTDEKITMATVKVGRSGFPMMAIKCWNRSGDLEIIVAPGPTMLAEEIENTQMMLYRIDKQEPVKLPAIKHSIGGFSAVATGYEPGHILVRSLAGSDPPAQKIIFEINSRRFEINVRGAAKALAPLKPRMDVGPRR